MEDNEFLFGIVVAVVIMTVVVSISYDIRKVQIAKYKCEVTNNE